MIKNWAKLSSVSSTVVNLSARLHLYSGGNVGTMDRLRRECMTKAFLLPFFPLVPNISLNVLQPSFPEILLESHMVMIRVCVPFSFHGISKSFWAAMTLDHKSMPCYRSIPPCGGIWKRLHYGFPWSSKAFPSPQNEDGGDVDDTSECLYSSCQALREALYIYQLIWYYYNHVEVAVIPSYRRGNWGTERSGNLPRITQLSVGGRSSPQSQAGRLLVLLLVTTTLLHL